MLQRERVYMKKKLLFITSVMAFMIIAGVILVALCGRKKPEQEDKLRVVSSFYPIYVILENLTEDVSTVEVYNLTDNQTGCLHDYQLTARDMRKLDGADLLIINGADMESFIYDIEDVYPELKIVTSTEGIDMIGSSGHEHDEENHESHEDANEAHGTDEHNEENLKSHDGAEAHGAEEHDEYDHEEHDNEAETHENDDHEEHDHEGHNHGLINGHVWMDINRYIQQIKNIEAALCELDAENSRLFHKNADRYIADVEKLRANYQKELMSVAGMNIIIFHDSFAYMADQLDMEIAYSIEIEGDEALSAGEIAEIIDIIRADKVKYLFVEEQYSDAIAKSIVSETDTEIICIDTLVTGDGTKNSYINGMEKNFNTLMKLVEE